MADKAIEFPSIRLEFQFLEGEKRSPLFAKDRCDHLIGCVGENSVSYCFNPRYKSESDLKQRHINQIMIFLKHELRRSNNKDNIPQLAFAIASIKRQLLMASQEIELVERE